MTAPDGARPDTSGRFDLASLGRAQEAPQQRVADHLLVLERVRVRVRALTWLERYRREFCLAPPGDLDLAALEDLAA